MKKNKLKYTTVGALASVAFCANVAAQSSDALLDKLVQKGILTRQEADELRKETDKDSSKATAKALLSHGAERISLVAMGNNAVTRTDEDELCALHLRNLLEGRPGNPESHRTVCRWSRS